MPYRVGQSTGHLLGPISLLLPALLLALERRRLVVAGLVLAALPLSGQLHLALGAIPLALGYGWARLPRALWWKVGVGAAGALAAGLVVQRWAVAGSIGTGRSFAQVERYSAELSDLVTRSVGNGVEELVFVGWLVPALALVGLWSVRRQRGLALVLGLCAVAPMALSLGANLPGYELLWRVTPGLASTRVPERFMPIACLALAGLVGLAVDAALSWVASRSDRPSPWWAAGVAGAALALAIAVDLRVPVFGAVPADTASAAYAAVDAPGRMLELPVVRPDIHYGSVYLGYARQSPRERPQGYSTLAEPAADRWARTNRSLSCGAGMVPDWIEWVVVHRGVYAQTRFFDESCPTRAEAMLARSGWQRVRRDGVITTWHRLPG